EDDSVFESDIRALARAGIARGCNPPANTRFCPKRAVSRGEMAAFLSRAFRLSETRLDRFTDDEGSVFEGDINRLAASGITRGCRQDRYCPFASVTREQMASF